MSQRKYFSGLVFLMLFAFSCSHHDVVVPDEDSFTGWIAGDSFDGYGTMLKSGDNGLSWFRQGSVSQIPGVDMNDISAMDQNYIWAVGDTLMGYGMIMFSADGGLTWERQGTKAMLDSAAMLAVYAKTGSRVWVCGEKGKLIYSDDKGNNWNPLILDSLSKAAFSGISVSGNSIWLIGNIADTLGNDSATVILHSTDGGQQFTASHPGSFTRLNSIFAVSDTLVFLTSGSTVYKSIDGGNQWYPVFTSITGIIRDVCASSETNIWAAGEQGRAFRSTDGGATWMTHWPQSGKYTLNEISLLDTARIWLCGSGNIPGRSGIVYYSNNAGRTWFIGNLPVDAGIRGMTFVKGVR